MEKKKNHISFWVNKQQQKKNVNAICLLTEHQEFSNDELVSKESVCSLEGLRENTRSRDENQQQTKPTYGVNAGNRTRHRHYKKK